ncbi:MAG: HD domain-containing protein [Patescibacteria group bacterium]
MIDLDKDIEDKIKVKALHYTKKGRPSWDVPYMLTAVYYIKKLLEAENGDPRILIPATYLHDIGYAGLLNEGYSYDDCSNAKKKHKVIGAKMSKKILKQIGYFTDPEIEAIARLVGIHDNFSEIKDKRTQLLFEADSLAQIDLERVEPSFNNENYRKFYQGFIRERVPLFKTETGKQHLLKLQKQVKTYIDNF